VTGFPIALLLFEGMHCLVRRVNSLPASRLEEESGRPVFPAGNSSTSTRKKPQAFVSDPSSGSKLDLSNDLSADVAFSERGEGLRNLFQRYYPGDC